jgi:hypothetical protein
MDLKLSSSYLFPRTEAFVERNRLQIVILCKFAIKGVDCLYIACSNEPQIQPEIRLLL